MLENLRNMNYVYLQLLDNMESKMKGTCVAGSIPKLFEGKMLVSTDIQHSPETNSIEMAAPT